MADKSVLIIGAGIGGLSAGCYAQINGYRVRILEMNSVPGGVCTAWRRDGYTFDGCVHNLAGSCPKSVFHSMWRELGVVPAIEMHAFDELVRVERPDGAPLVVHCDLDRLAAHMKQLSPDDAAVIDELVIASRRFRDFEMMGLALAGPLGRLAILRVMPTLIKYSGVTMTRFAGRFTDPFLRRAFPTLLYDGPDVPVLLLLSFLGRMEIGDLGWPVGGSANFARAIAQRFAQLGGEITYGTQVASILTEGDRAVGVRLADGSAHHADIIVSNAYGPATIFEMLGGRYVSNAINAYYDSPEDRVEMGVHVSLGVARHLAPEPHAIVLPLNTPVIIAGEERDRFFVETFGFDESLAPPGKSVLKVVFATSCKYWERVHAAPERYAAEKAAIADAVISQLEHRFPGFRQEIEVVDVATPITTKRFTGNGHGFKVSGTRMMLAMLTGKKLSQTLAGLRNFYMVGQWAGLPGLPLVAAMGKDLACAMCRNDGKPFVTA
ncbi:MAG: NAD(P)/FAD-dependent oxidoreductase [Paracoccaceae bacterium]|nr:NAD(P)/FAD-dependent oxidoreductase [Paracoccaceae bacterium]